MLSSFSGKGNAPNATFLPNPKNLAMPKRTPITNMAFQQLEANICRKLFEKEPQLCSRWGSFD